MVEHAQQAPLALFESGAILLYLAEKTGRFLPQDAARRYEAIQWLMFQMGGIGPMFGQVGFFHKFAGKDFEDKRPRDRYIAEARRLLGVLNPSPDQHRAKIKEAIAERNQLAGMFGLGTLAAMASTYHPLGVASYTTVNDRVISVGALGMVFFIQPSQEK